MPVRLLPRRAARARAALAGAAAAAVAGAAAVATATAGSVAPAARDLLPNLLELPPTDLAVWPARDGSARWELRFTSIAGNNGEGPLVVRSTRPSATAAWRSVQVISLAGGGTREVALPVRIAYEPRPGHGHFHIARFERYELVAGVGGAGAGGAGERILARDSKAGYCLGDRALLGTQPARQRYTGTCRRGQSAARTLEQGISPGWADPYPADLPGQAFLLSGLAAGEYTLVNRVNDQGLYREASTADNAAAAVFRLSWPDGGSAKPVVEVLRTCLADRCGRPS